MVRRRGFEPLRLAALDPKSSVYANSTTFASATEVFYTSQADSSTGGRRLLLHRCSATIRRPIGCHGFRKRLLTPARFTAPHDDTVCVCLVIESLHPVCRLCFFSQRIVLIKNENQTFHGFTDEKRVDWVPSSRRCEASVPRACVGVVRSGGLYGEGKYAATVGIS